MDLRKRLAAVERLAKDGATPGERDAARLAAERIRARMSGAAANAGQNPTGNADTYGNSFQEAFFRAGRSAFRDIFEQAARDGFRPWNGYTYGFEQEKEHLRWKNMKPPCAEFQMHEMTTALCFRWVLGCEGGRIRIVSFTGCCTMGSVYFSPTECRHFDGIRLETEADQDELYEALQADIADAFNPSPLGAQVSMVVAAALVSTLIGYQRAYERWQRAKPSWA